MDQDILFRPQSRLSDAIINAAQELLKKGNPIDECLQNVNLGLPKSFFSTERGEFVQILHTGQSHWQVVSTIGTQHPEVNIYDSVCIILVQTTAKYKLPVYWQPMSQSLNLDTWMYRCSLVWQIVASLPSLLRLLLLTDIHQASISFTKVYIMQAHLLQCIESGNLTMFPIQKVRRSYISENKEGREPSHILHMQDANYVWIRVDNVFCM